MVTIPNDVRAKIEEDFHGEEKEIVSLIFQKICQFNSNYSIQVLRSILFLSAGNFNRAIRLYLAYQEDPRDVIGEAEERAGNPGHWFGIPFEDMPNFKKTILPPPLPPQVVNDLPF